MEQASSDLNSANINSSTSSEDPNLHRAFTPTSSDLSAQSFMGDFAEATHDLLMDESAPRRAAARAPGAVCLGSPRVAQGQLQPLVLPQPSQT